ncbi:DNA binding domain protein, excisionase family [Desulfotomaculum nigrificans CO-1-SRB]|uniref:DNA binding domain protein, excisionase family n=1 Tax=Desulfotomaculum nigrificans (strain DSM 14880 / VKM B-2319 / CO-1-SRB) TaxID=868595 RepID=F6B6P0_DESCC|nr:helix-turn-helix transcriptional regulator [Desulfotomaculum nigrificans]AEF94414.1 DNA binding domain protein, excisionase family [Desulfotomaculum nigrificans CO-1-SRB]
MEEISLTPEEVAIRLKIAKNTVYELIKRGDLPAYRVGRKIRVDLKDVEAYKKQGKKVELTLEDTAPVPGLTREVVPRQTINTANEIHDSRELVICGQDVLLDILTRHLERHPHGTRAFRHYVGSFPGLLALYQENVDMAAIHLWDGDTGVYNIPYVRRLLPGIPAMIIHLACRMQGFYVAKGNPKNIKDWHDLTRRDIRFINREKGSGTRVLLDEKLRLLGLDRRLINGYHVEGPSHLAIASAVARGDADVGLGNEKVSMQVRGIEFVPLQKEHYELVMKKEDIHKPCFQAVLEILQSREFKKELEGLGDYDLNETGKIVAEI